MKTLFKHQVEGAQWLAAKGKGLLGDIPGMGKTDTAIEGLQKVGAQKPLIVCPAIARTHWERSLLDAEYDGRPEVVSFEKLTSEGLPGMARRLITNKVDALVVDEFHYGKTSTAARAKILFGNDGYARRLETVFGLSGSIPKHPGEFYNVLVSLFPNVMTEHGVPTRDLFMTKFTERFGFVARGRWIEKVVGQRNVEELREILSKTMLKRTLEDAGLDVPKVWWQTITVDSDAPDDATNCVGMVNRAIASSTLDEIAEDPHIARMRRRLGELKAPAVVKMLRAQLEGTEEKVVVFAHHRSVMHELRNGLAEFGVEYVDGDTSEKARDYAEFQFQNDPKCRIYLGQNIACRYSLTLTAAHRAILVEPDWSADTNYQLGQRIARIGSTAAHCIGQMIAMAGTLDEAIVRQNERETRMSEELFLKEGLLIA